MSENPVPSSSSTTATTSSTAGKVAKNPIKIVGAPHMHWVGDGLPVYNSIDYNGIGRFLNPFIMLDYGAPYEFQPYHRPRGVGMHPHRGFETVTVAFQGEITHTDSTGMSDTIYAGDVQWMTAGSGIEHQEMHSDAFTNSGGTLEMLQLWVNLPAKDKMSKPGYQAITSKSIPHVELPDNAGTIDLVAGEYNGKKGPANTFTPINLWSVKLKKGAKFHFEVEDGWNTGIFVRRGSFTVKGKTASFKDLVVFSREGESVDIYTEEGAELFIMSGEPIDEPIAAYGPMVMNTRDEIVQAFTDYQDGKFSNL